MGHGLVWGEKNPHIFVGNFDFFLSSFWFACPVCTPLILLGYGEVLPFRCFAFLLSMIRLHFRSGCFGRPAWCHKPSNTLCSHTTSLHRRCRDEITLPRSLVTIIWPDTTNPPEFFYWIATDTFALLLHLALRLLLYVFRLYALAGLGHSLRAAMSWFRLCVEFPV